MELSEEKKKVFIRRLLLSRTRIMFNFGFYGLLLMSMKFKLDEDVETISTDAEYIYINPAFLDSLTDPELDFVLLQEILHVIMGHYAEEEQGEENDGEQKKGDEKNSDKDEVVENEIRNSCGMYEKDFSEGRDYKDLRDDHSKWVGEKEDSYLNDVWEKRIIDAYEAVKMMNTARGAGSIPSFLDRLLSELKKPQVDWKTILTNFIQEEITDYSFTPPDRRFDEGDFFLPDFNEKDDHVENILFMIDTSGSMSEEMITTAYSEVKGAIDQFGGKLKGWLGFFDAQVVEPKAFSDEEEFKIIRPVGGGGTSFHVIFEYVRDNMMSDPPVSIIIMTDGYASEPAEKMAMGIPVLWLITDSDVTPSWGKIARIHSK